MKVVLLAALKAELMVSLTAVMMALILVVWKGLETVEN